MVSEARGQGNVRMGRSAVPIARHNFRSAMEIFPRAMVSLHWGLGKIHDDAEWTPIAIGDFRASMVLVCMGRDAQMRDLTPLVHHRRRADGGGPIMQNPFSA